MHMLPWCRSPGQGEAVLGPQITARRKDGTVDAADSLEVR